MSAIPLQIQTVRRRQRRDRRLRSRRDRRPRHLRRLREFRRHPTDQVVRQIIPNQSIKNYNFGQKIRVEILLLFFCKVFANRQLPSAVSNLASAKCQLVTAMSIFVSATSIFASAISKLVSAISKLVSAMSVPSSATSFLVSAVIRKIRETFQRRGADQLRPSLDDQLRNAEGVRRSK